VNLSPVGGVAGQFFDNNGDPLVGGKLFTFSAGTTTPQVTYTSASGTTPNSNPIILNGGGRVPSEIWLTDGLQYKFVLYSSTDQLIGSWDNVIGINSNFVNYTSQQEIQTATAGQTVFTLTTMQYLPGTNSLSVFVDGVNQYGPGAQYAYVETDATTVTFVTGLHVGASVKFTTNAINASSYGDAFQISYTAPYVDSVATSVGDKLADTVSVKDFGAVGDGVVDDTTAIKSALLASANVFFPSGNYLITETIVLYGALLYSSTDAKALHFDDGVTITKTGTNVGDSAYDAIFAIKKQAGTGDCYNVRIYGRPKLTAAGSDYGIVYESAGAKNYVQGATIVAKTCVYLPVNIWQSQWDDLMMFPSVSGFVMTASGTSNILNRPFVFGATVLGYNLRGDYSTANSLAADECTGIAYQFNFANWQINGIGCESGNSTNAISVANNSYVNMTAGLVLSAGTSDGVFFVGSDSVLNAKNITVGFSFTPIARAGKLYRVIAGGGCAFIDCEINDTFAQASLGNANIVTTTSSSMLGTNGVQFPAVITYSTGVHDLDEYTEFAYAATLTGSTGGSLLLGNLTYVKIGQIVYVNGFFYDRTGTGFSGDLQINLPFEPINNEYFAPLGHDDYVLYFDGTGATTVEIQEPTGNPVNKYAAVDSTIVNSANSWNFSFTYRTQF